MNWRATFFTGALILYATPVLCSDPVDEPNQSADPNRETQQPVTVLQVTDPGAKIIVGVLVLVGTILTTLVAWYGHFLRRDYENRRIELSKLEQDRLKLEKERELRLAEQEQERLKFERDRELRLAEQEQFRSRTDTMVGALRLFSTEQGAEVSDSQRAGAFLALARLGQHDFTLALLRAMWPAGHVGPDMAVWVIDECLSSSSTIVQDSAAGILRDNAKHAVFEGDFCWPASVTWKARPDLSVDAREALLQALVSMVHLQPVDWDRESLASLFNNLHVMIDDKDPSIRAGALHGASEVLHGLEQVYEVKELAFPTGFEFVDQIRSALKARIDKLHPDESATDRVLEHIHLIEKRWDALIKDK